ncbi:hypothetical protein ACFOET_07995 [Parapedobacter deserti]|uniref:Secreted protein n=1 Tax=Parapedobacter deserti TaxID=1912957 RepID=A0ABV7JK40_9SPHI
MVNKTITYIKQYFFMLALAATFVGFSAFKANEMSGSKNAAQWYFVERIDANEDDYSDSNLKISGPETEEPADPDCNTTNAGNTCAVQLNNPSSTPIADGTALTSLPAGVSIQEHAQREL